MNDSYRQAMDDDELDVVAGGIQMHGDTAYLCFCKKCKKFVGPYKGKLPRLFNETIAQYCPNCKAITTQEITETNFL